MTTIPADGSDFLLRAIPAVSISPSTATATGGLPRETCTFVRIFDDVFFEEDVEFFELDLLLDPSTFQSGVILEPNVTTIFIQENGNLASSVLLISLP